MDYQNIIYAKVHKMRRAGGGGGAAGAAAGDAAVAGMRGPSWVWVQN